MEQSLKEIRDEYGLLLEIGTHVMNGGATWEAATDV